MNVAGTVHRHLVWTCWPLISRCFILLLHSAWLSSLLLSSSGGSCAHFSMPSFVLIVYFGFRFTAAYNHILFCCLIFVVVVHAAGCDKQDSLMRGSLCAKLCGRLSQLLLPCPGVINPVAKNHDFCLPHL